MNSSKFRGMGIALITPFDSKGNIDYKSLKDLATYQVNEGADFLVLLGTTGESATIEEDERIGIVDSVLEAVGGRCPIIVGVGGNYTLRLERRLQAMDKEGVDGILSVCPYYNKPSQEGIYQHFKALSQSVDLPFILYNIPGRTGINMSSDTTLRLAHDCANVVGIKEAAADIEQVRRIVKDKPQGFCVLSGDDHLSIPFIREGAEGVISVIGNAYPKLFTRLIHAALGAEWERALTIDKEFEALYKYLFTDGNPAGIKSLLFSMGLQPGNYLRLPLVPASESTQKALAQAANELAYRITSLV